MRKDPFVGTAEIAQREAVVSSARVKLEVLPVTQHARAVGVGTVEFEISQQLVQLLKRLAVHRQMRILELEARQIVAAERRLRIGGQNDVMQLRLKKIK
jgi:hypothetical protein